jgi:aminomethyltransferase
MLWKEWSGHHAVRSYDVCHEPEYLAIRHAAGLIDVSPLHKYEVTGPDAATFLARITVRDIRKLKIGRVVYLCWCDDEGKVMDDGTVTRLDDEHFRITANGPTLSWLRMHQVPYRVDIEDSSESIAALALQGPTSRDILNEVCDTDLASLKFFRATRAKIAGVPVHVSRTGYTGDLGYEVWVDRDNALSVWDAVIGAGQPYRIEAAGLDAMDVTRIEAGFILNGVDYFSAHHCLIDSRKSSPFEIGLGWTVKLERDPFIGQASLKREKERGSTWALAGLVYDWDEYEALFAEFGLPPHVPGGAWRTALPVYTTGTGGRQIGQATSGAWSPTLKKNLALASLHAEHRKPGTRLQVEITAEYQRRTISATVTPTPFFNPERKRA